LFNVAVIKSPASLMQSLILSSENIYALATIVWGIEHGASKHWSLPVGVFNVCPKNVYFQWLQSMRMHWMVLVLEPQDQDWGLEYGGQNQGYGEKKISSRIIEDDSGLRMVVFAVFFYKLWPL